MATAKELRGKDVDDLDKLLGERGKELMDLRFSHATGALENASRLSKVKRDIARIRTVLNERRLASSAAAEQ